MKKFLLLLQICLLAVVASAGKAQAPLDDHALISRLASFRFGGDTAVPMAVAERVSSARLDPRSRRTVAHELAVILRESRSYDVRQFICRQLVFIGSTEQIPVLASLLTDEDLAEYALLPLARIPGKPVNDALLRALPRTHGRTKVEILDTLADRGDVRALPAAVALLGSRDAEIQAGAAHAMAKLPVPQAAQALRSVYAHLSAPRRSTVGDALLDCAIRCERRGDVRDSAAVYSALSEPTASPTLRAAALRGMVRVHPSEAVALLLTALREDRTARQKMAAALARDVPGAALALHLSQALPKLTVRGKQLLLEALADRGDRAAAPAVIALCRTSLPQVRVAAIRALGRLGGPGDIPLLLSTAAEGPPQNREAARASLVQLRGLTVDDALARTLRTARPRIKVEAIQALGLRGAARSVAHLVAEARDPEPTVRSAAFHVLRDLGPPALLPKLVDLLLATPIDGRDAAIETVTEVARRGGTPESRTSILITRLATATQSADRASLLAVLGQLGESAGLPALRSGLTDSEPEVRATALAALSEWPNDEPMNDLLGVVQASGDERQRAVALRGYLRMLVGNEQRAPEEALKLLRAVAPNASLADDKRLVLSGVARIQSLEALEFAATYLTDPDVRPEAESAAVAISQATVGAFPDRTRAVLERIAGAGVNEEARKRAVAVLASVGKSGGFIMTWEVSPAYLRDGADFSRLFDIAFPPEDPASAKQVPWRLMPTGTSSDQPWLLDLLAAVGGEQRVAYLRTAVHTDSARDLVLELGSDDGIKVWWNGEMVFGHNIARGISPAQEKVPVHARQGWNSLLLKITQNNMGWAACARATNPDGSQAAGLGYGVPSSLPAQ